MFRVDFHKNYLDQFTDMKNLQPILALLGKFGGLILVTNSRRSDVNGILV